MIMKINNEHEVAFVGYAQGNRRVWACTCGLAAFRVEMSRHLNEHLNETLHHDFTPRPKTAPDHFQELGVAFRQLRTAVITSLPNVIRKALKRWDIERTP